MFLAAAVAARQRETGSGRVPPNQISMGHLGLEISVGQCAKIK